MTRVINVLGKYLKYLWYVIRHKWYVFVECCKLDIPWLGIIHDWSKLALSELAPYVESFYGGWGDDRPQWVKDDFDLAWLYHQRRNKHHWQYWILVQDEDEDRILPMPDKYRREMLADWHGAGRAITGKKNTAEWYPKSKDKMQLHPETRAWIEKNL